MGEPNHDLTIIFYDYILKSYAVALNNRFPDATSLENLINWNQHNGKNNLKLGMNVLMR